MAKAHTFLRLQHLNVDSSATSGDQRYPIQQMAYRKHYIPLESNPVLFTQLIHQIGVSPILAFHDVLSIDDSELLAISPRPALALVLAFPTSSDYEKNLEEQGRLIPDHYETAEGENVMWYKQTINNACGLYAILHAVSNGDARDFIRK
jgi:ubiquitin carboxyl-terminal hydrolase L3